MKKSRGRPRKDPPSKGAGSRRSKTFAKSKDPRAHPKWKEEFIAIAEYMVAKEDASDVEIAAVLGCHPSTLYEWKRLIPKFRKAFKRGEAKQITTVEAAMFKRATGYTHKTEKIFQYQGNIVRAKTDEIFPPDPASAKLFLTGAAPEKYGDKLQLENSKTRPIAFIIQGLHPEAPKTETAKKGKKEAKNERPDPPGP